MHCTQQSGGREGRRANRPQNAPIAGPSPRGGESGSNFLWNCPALSRPGNLSGGAGGRQQAVACRRLLPPQRTVGAGRGRPPNFPLALKICRPPGGAALVWASTHGLVRARGWKRNGGEAQCLATGPHR